MGARTEFPARGACGGKAGALREYRLNGEVVHPKGRYELATGDVLELLDAGGGGYGDPANRDPRRVEEDLRQGFVSPEAAARDYGFGRMTEAPPA
jgi:N-methylhydantoinase B